MLRKRPAAGEGVATVAYGVSNDVLIAADAADGAIIFISCCAKATGLARLRAFVERWYGPDAVLKDICTPTNSGKAASCAQVETEVEARLMAQLAALVSWFERADDATPPWASAAAGSGGWVYRLHATPFARQVLREVRLLRRGETASYRDIAEAIAGGKRRSEHPGDERSETVAFKLPHSAPRRHGSPAGRADGRSSVNSHCAEGENEFLPPPAPRKLFRNGGSINHVKKNGRTLGFGFCERRKGSRAPLCTGVAAFRAVGQALGRNPLMFLIPCHRVILAGGGLGGFAGGVAVKHRLLEREGALQPP